MTLSVVKTSILFSFLSFLYLKQPCTCRFCLRMFVFPVHILRRITLTRHVCRVGNELVCSLSISAFRFVSVCSSNPKCLSDKPERGSFQIFTNTFRNIPASLVTQIFSEISLLLSSKYFQKYPCFSRPNIFRNIPVALVRLLSEISLLLSSNNSTGQADYIHFLKIVKCDCLGGKITETQQQT